MKKVLVAVAVLLLVGVGGLVFMLERPSEGPEPVAWDQASCSHCHMHVGDPSYAAQAREADGTVHYFDDPGCLFEWEQARSRAPQEMYFHHYRRDDHWIAADEVGFVEVDEDTPMGYGLGAVDRAEHPDSLSLSRARQKVLAGESGSRR